MNCENGSENQFNTATTGSYGSLLMDSVWNSIPCIDLLALADAAVTPKGFGVGDGEQGVNMQFQNKDGGSSFMPISQTGGVRYLFDLNSPPTSTEPQLITSISSTLTPVMPKQTRKAVRKRVVSEILNSKTDGRTDQTAVNLEQSKPVMEQSQDEVWQLELNEDSEEESSVDLTLQKTPQPKPKRRKHRPKVVIEGQSKKLTPPKSKGSSTGKRKNISNITPEKFTGRPIRSSCRRKIYFEEEAYDKTCSLSPITPNKSEIEMGAKDTCSRAKRNIIFSKNAHEKVLSRNDSTCSISEDASLEACITNFPAVFKKKRTEKCYNSITSKAISSKWSHEMSTVYGVINQQYYKNILGFGDVQISRKKRSMGRKRVRDMGSFAGMIEGKSPWMCVEALAAADFSLNVSTKKRTKRNYSIVPSSSYHKHWSLTNHIGFHSRWKSRYDIDALINQFEILCINNQNVKRHQHAIVPYFTRYRERNGLVLYQHNRSLVPFEGSYGGVKIRKPRPKVHLDDETSRVWRLLLEDINSEGIDGTDKDKTKWWEEERNVFSGRAASFIARMHLIQGDRRFSRWKGSVVDSVIGVFLTQNVSDHLSR